MSVTQQDMQTFAPKLLLVRHTGALLMWFQQSYYFQGEPEKLQPQVSAVTVKNLLFGWWSIVSLFANPFVTISNLVRFSNYKKEYQRYITAPEQYVFEAKERHESGADARKRRSEKITMTVCIVLLIVAFLVTVGIILDS